MEKSITLDALDWQEIPVTLTEHHLRYTTPRGEVQARIRWDDGVGEYDYECVLLDDWITTRGGVAVSVDIAKGKVAGIIQGWLDNA